MAIPIAPNFLTTNIDNKTPIIPLEIFSIAIILVFLAKNKPGKNMYMLLINTIATSTGIKLAAALYSSVAKITTISLEKKNGTRYYK